MKTLILDAPFISLNGSEIPGSNIAETLADLLIKSQADGTDAIKYFDWGMKLFESKEISLDKADFKKLYSLVEKANLPVLSKAQILKKLDEEDKRAEKE